MADTFQVVGECAYATVDTAVGRSKVLLYKGAVLPAGTPELTHLLETGLVAKVAGDDELGVNALGELGVAESAETSAGPVVTAGPATSPASGDGSAKTGDGEVDAKRAAARAKLAEMGGTPDGRSSEAVWVEYAVGQGVDRAEAEKAGRDELKKMFADK